MQIAVQVDPHAESTPAVDYRWDPDTDILSARLRAHSVTDGAAGSIEVAGDDGSWLILDLAAGRINGVEVAVWPDVRKRPVLEPPASVEHGHAVVSGLGAMSASIELSTPVMAESDDAERTIHFRLGEPRRTRALRLGRDLLLELDAQSRLAGVWFLNVPPFPLDA